MSNQNENIEMERKSDSKSNTRNEGNQHKMREAFERMPIA